MEFHIYGEGSLKPELNRLIEELKFEGKVLTERPSAATPNRQHHGQR